MKTLNIRTLPVAFHKIEFSGGGVTAYSGVSTMTASATIDVSGVLVVNVSGCPVPMPAAVWRRVAKRRARATGQTREASLEQGIHGAELLYQQLALGQLGGSRLRALTKARHWAADSAIRLATWLERYPEATQADFLAAELLAFLDLAEGALR